MAYIPRPLLVAERGHNMLGLHIPGPCSRTPNQAQSKIQLGQIEILSFPLWHIYTWRVGKPTRLLCISSHGGECKMPTPNRSMAQEIWTVLKRSSLFIKLTLEYSLTIHWGKEIYRLGGACSGLDSTPYITTERHPLSWRQKEVGNTVSSSSLCVSLFIILWMITIRQ